MKLAILLISTLIGMVSPSRADVIFQLNWSTLTGQPGSTISFNGTLSNETLSDVYLNGDVSNLPSTDLTLDDSSFFINAPLFLAPQQSYTGPFFSVSVDPSTPAGLYDGFFAIYGGADSAAFDELATQEFPSGGDYLNNKHA